MISVIIPVYNVEKYLDTCLRSVLTNTYSDLEVICVNDGSTDSSLEILQKWQAEDSRIVIVSHENQRLPEARNSGLEVMTGEYTAFIDADDWVHPKYFESMLKCMEETNADMVVCETRKFELDESIDIDPNIEPRFNRLSAKALFDNTYFRRAVWAKLYRRRDTKSLRFPPEVDAAQDTLYNMRLISNLDNPIVYQTNSQLYYYLQRSNSLFKSRSYNEGFEIAEWYVNNGRDPLHKKTGKWSWLLLMHCTSTILSIRYTANLYKNQDFVQHANTLLRPMLKDMIIDKYFSFTEKIARAIMILSPTAYRLFRLINDPSMIQYERTVRSKYRKDS